MLRRRKNKYSWLQDAGRDPIQTRVDGIIALPKFN
jgi:hypothetical protein